VIDFEGGELVASASGKLCAVHAWAKAVNLFRGHIKHIKEDENEKQKD